MATTTLDTTDYVNTHGKQPRGCAEWAFSPDWNGDTITVDADGNEVRTPVRDKIVTLTGTLTECSKQLGGGRWILRS
jgi:hypothetical protein